MNPCVHEACSRRAPRSCRAGARPAIPAVVAAALLAVGPAGCARSARGADGATTPAAVATATGRSPETIPIPASSVRGSTEQGELVHAFQNLLRVRRGALDEGLCLGVPLPDPSGQPIAPLIDG